MKLGPLLTISIFSILVLSAASLFSQVTFEKIYETPYSYQKVSGGIQDNDGNYIVAFEEDDIFNLFKTDSFGNLLWVKEFDYGMTSGFYGQSICADENRYFVGGYIIGMGTGSRDGSIFITDYDGNAQSMTKIDDGMHSNAIHAASSMDEGFILAGRSEGGNGGQYDFSMMKLNPGGSIEWARSYGGSGWDWAKWAEPTSDMGYIITGFADGFAGAYDDIYIVKTNDAGIKEWSKAIDSGNAETANFIRQDNNNNYIIGGYTLGMDGSNTYNKGFVSKLSSTGSLIWTIIIRDIWDVQGMVLTDDNSIVIVGEAYNHVLGYGAYDIFMMKIDSTGTEVFSRIFGGPDGDYPFSIDKTDDGGFLIAGATSSYGAAGSSHVYLIKTDENGRTYCNDIILNADYATAYPLIFNPVDTSDVGYEQVDFVPVLDTTSFTVFDPCCPDQVYANFGFENDLTDTIYTFLFTDQSTGTGDVYWDFGDGTTSLDPDPIHTFADTGIYVVCLTIESTCDTSVLCQDIYITLPDTSNNGINVIEDNIIKIFPQPASNYVHVNHKFNDSFEVTFLDSEGRVVSKNQYVGIRNNITLDVKKLKSGIYYLVFRNETEVLRQKLVILKQ